MVEIMLGVYLFSLISSVLLVLWHLTFISHQFQSKTLAILNTNLEKIGLYWSNANSDFNHLEIGNPTADQERVRRSVLLAGLLGFASLPGMLLLFVIILSMRYFARSRKERAVFESPLVRENHLSVDKVSSLVNELRQIY